MRTLTRSQLAGVVLLFAVIGAPAAAPVRPADNAGADRFQSLYGVVVTGDGKRYEGPLRWGDEEAFWDDTFNGTKEELPYIDRLPEADRPHSKIVILGIIPIGFREEGAGGRQFAARFGDIKEIRPGHGNVVELLMKSGSIYRLDGGSDDIGAVVHVDDAVSGGTDVRWRDIARIVFGPVPVHGPRAARPAASSGASEAGSQSPPNPPVPSQASRLYGDVQTEAGTFTGFIQWDAQECLTTDKLDGDDAKGRISVEMGRIRTIEKASRDAARVETSDGRTLDLHGTNDVNNDNRGIYVEDARFGRVRIQWDVFKRAAFRPPTPAAGHAYGDFAPTRPLRGTVIGRSGAQWKGKIVFDLDESETWEMLDGVREGIGYSIPFERVRSIEPLESRTTLVTLTNGQKLQLGDTQDVGAKNAGVLILAPGSAPEHYVPWRDVMRIDFE